MQINEYKPGDVVRVTRKYDITTGVVQRSFTSGGNRGLRVVGVTYREKDEPRNYMISNIFVYNSEEVELLWREDSEAK